MTLSERALDTRVLAALRGGNTTARAIGLAEGINGTAVRNALARLEAAGLATSRSNQWRAR